VEHERWIASLRTTLATAEDELGRLRRRDAEISSWNETLTASIAEAESVAEAHLGEKEDLTRQLAELRQTLGSLQAENLAQQRKLGEMIRHAEKSGRHAEELDRLLAEILSSRIWRLGRTLTAPARWGRGASPADSQYERLHRAVSRERPED
jgi:septal ring factor EnvC (AmiA/AmiB activator)